MSSGIVYFKRNVEFATINDNDLVTNGPSWVATELELKQEEISSHYISQLANELCIDWLSSNKPLFPYIFLVFILLFCQPRSASPATMLYGAF